LQTIPLASGQVNPQSDYRARYDMQRAAARILPRERVSLCCTRPVPNKDHEGVHVLAGQGSATFANLQRCGSVWLCPVCAARISEVRRKELHSGLSSWAGQGGAVVLVTLTLSHNRGDSLSHLLKVLKKAREGLTSGRWASDLKETYGIVGMVRSLEITWGEGSGWHPHMHILYFFRSAPKVIGFEQDMKARWASVVSSLGEFASYTHGCDVRLADGEISGYVTKVSKGWGTAEEMTKQTVKRGRSARLSPMDLLHAATVATSEDERRRWAGLWMQYALTLKGERQLFYSQGLRDVLRLVEEKTDEEVVAGEAQELVHVATLEPRAWSLVVGEAVRGEVLTAFASGVSNGLDFLYSLGVPPAWVWLPPAIHDAVFDEPIAVV